MAEPKTVGKWLIRSVMTKFGVGQKTATGVVLYVTEAILADAARQHRIISRHDADLGMAGRVFCARLENAWHRMSGFATKR